MHNQCSKFPFTLKFDMIPFKSSIVILQEYAYSIIFFISINLNCRIAHVESIFDSKTIRPWNYQKVIDNEISIIKKLLKGSLNYTTSPSRKYNSIPKYIDKKIDRTFDFFLYIVKDFYSNILKRYSIVMKQISFQILNSYVALTGRLCIRL